MAQAVA